MQMTVVQSGQHRVICRIDDDGVLTSWIAVENIHGSNGQDLTSFEQNGAGIDGDSWSARRDWQDDPVSDQGSAGIIAHAVALESVAGHRSVSQNVLVNTLPLALVIAAPRLPRRSVDREPMRQ